MIAYRRRRLLDAARYEATATRQMCGRLGVGIQFSTPYAHHMLGKAERPWRTIRDNAFAMMHNMSIPNAMWSCAVSIVVYLRNRTYNRAVGFSRGVPLTLLAQVEPDASKLRVFGCVVFAKVPHKLRRKLGEKAFRGVMVSYPPYAMGYRVYNPVTLRITTSVHVMFQENVPRFLPSLDTCSLISDETATVSGDAMFMSSHVVSPDPVHIDDGPPMHDDTRQTRIRSHPIRFGEYVAHLSAYPPVYVTACYELEQGATKEDIVEHAILALTVAAPPHQPAGTAVALLSARDYVEPASYRAALSRD
jgi:hypothetical protein